MKRVRIIVPFDGHSVGDEREFFGHVARKHIAEGRAEDIADPAEDGDVARPKRRRSSRKV